MFQEAINAMVDKINNMTGEEIYNWLLSVGVEYETSNEVKA